MPYSCSCTFWLAFLITNVLWRHFISVLHNSRRVSDYLLCSSAWLQHNNDRLVTSQQEVLAQVFANYDNQPYDESIEVPDEEEIESIYSPVVNKHYNRLPGSILSRSSPHLSWPSPDLLLTPPASISCLINSCKAHSSFPLSLHSVAFNVFLVCFVLKCFTLPVHNCVPDSSFEM